MIQALKDEDLINRIGGRFKLATLMQKRMRELMMGARPLVEPGKLTPMELVVREILEGKIKLKAGEDTGESAEA